MGFLAHRLAITHCTDYCVLLDLQQICSKISPLGCSRSPDVRRPSDNSPHPSRSLHLELIIGRKMPYEYGKLWSRTSQQSRLSLRGRARRQRSSGRSPADLEGSAPRCPVGTFGGGVEHHHCAVDRGPGAVNVLAKILVVRRVQSTEMSRSLTTAVQSERTRRRSPRALTSPASWIARQTMAISRSRWSCRRRGARCSQIWAGPQSRRSGWSSIGCSCCRDGAVAHRVSPTAIERRDIKRSWSITTELGEIGPAWRIISTG